MNTQIKILSAIFVILVLGVVVFWGNDSGPSKTQDKKFLNFDQDQVDSFQINNFTVSFLFQKNGDAWKIKRVKNDLTKRLEKKAGATIGDVDKDFTDANSVEVAKSLTYLSEIKNLNPISTQAKLAGTFEINDYSLHAIFFDKDGKELDRVYIGKSGPDPFTSFLKKTDSPNVYLADQDFRALLLRNYGDWLQKSRK